MSDLVAFLIASLVVSALITAVSFAMIRVLLRKRIPLLIISASVFPFTMVGLAFYVVHFGFDPHGFTMAAFVMIGVGSIPATALTSWLLAKRFA